MPGLDTLRSAAIGSVMLFHFAPFLPPFVSPVAQFGWAGVDLFFALSGYLIGYQLLSPYRDGRRPSLGQFYRRRAFRILPVYFIVLMLYFTVPAWSEAPRLAPLWQYLTFTANFSVNYATHQAFNHVWSLCIEEHFYLVLPLLLSLTLRKPSLRAGILGIALALVAGIALRAALVFGELQPFGTERASRLFAMHVYCPTFTHLDGLVVGVALALVRVFRPQWWAWIARYGHATLAAGLAAIALGLWLCKDLFTGMGGVAPVGAIVGFTVLALGFGSLVLSSASTGGWLHTVSVPGAKYVALLAYSLYLIHQSVVHVDRTLFPAATAGRGLEALSIYVASCIACASVLYFGVERPFMALRDRLDRQLRDEPAR